MLNEVVDQNRGKGRVAADCVLMPLWDAHPLFLVVRRVLESPLLIVSVNRSQSGHL